MFIFQEMKKAVKYHDEKILIWRKQTGGPEEVKKPAEILQSSAFDALFI